MAYAYNPSTLGGQGGRITRSGNRDHPGHSETPSLLKYKKISLALWCVLVDPGTQEAKAGELLEPGRQVAVSRDYSTALQPCDSKNQSQKKTKTNKQTKKTMRKFKCLLLSKRSQSEKGT